MPAKPDPKKILDEAMQLEPTTRAFIAETLLESLDLDQDFAVSPEWLEEIRRRSGEQGRPEGERDYLKRLLDLF